jgi:hypothetical protein
MERIVARTCSGSTTSRPRIMTWWSPSSTTGDRVLYAHGQVMLGGEVILTIGQPGVGFDSAARRKL